MFEIIHTKKDIEYYIQYMYMTCTYIYIYTYMHKSHCILYLFINSMYYTCFLVTHINIYIYIMICCWQQAYGVLLNLATTSCSWSHKRTLCHTIATATLVKVPGYDWPEWPEHCNADTLLDAVALTLPKVKTGETGRMPSPFKSRGVSAHAI